MRWEKRRCRNGFGIILHAPTRRRERCWTKGARESKSRTLTQSHAHNEPEKFSRTCTAKKSRTQVGVCGYAGACSYGCSLCARHKSAFFCIVHVLVTCVLYITANESLILTCVRVDRRLALLIIRVFIFFT